MVSLTSIVSTTPASRVVISSDHGSPAVVTANVVLLPAMSALGVTLLPDQLEWSPPYISVSMVLVMSTVVVVVDCIEP